MDESETRANQPDTIMPASNVIASSPIALTPRVRASGGRVMALPQRGSLPLLSCGRRWWCWDLLAAAAATADGFEPAAAFGVLRRFQVAHIRFHGQCRPSKHPFLRSFFAFLFVVVSRTPCRPLRTHAICIITERATQTKIASCQFDFRYSSF